MKSLFLVFLTISSIVFFGCSEESPSERLESLRSEVFSLGSKALNACGKAYEEKHDEESRKLRPSRIQLDLVPRSSECRVAAQKACEKTIDYFVSATDENLTAADLSLESDIYIVVPMIVHCMGSDYDRALRALSDALRNAV